jgi:hypothetical protein
MEAPGPFFHHASADGHEFFFTTPAKVSIYLTFPLGTPAPLGIIGGLLRVECSAPLNIRGLRVRASGHALVHWTTGSGKHRRSHDARVELLGESPFAPLFGEGEERGDADYMLCVGTRDFPFCLPPLPPGAPSSCALGAGRVAYAVEAWLDVRGRPDVIASAALPVLAAAPPPPRLAALPMPQRADAPLHTFCCLGDAGVAHLSVALPPGGHVLPPRGGGGGGGAPPLRAFVGAGVAPPPRAPLQRLPAGSERAALTLLRRVVCRAGGASTAAEEVVGEGAVPAQLLPPRGGGGGGGGGPAADAEKGGWWDGAMLLQEVQCEVRDLALPSFHCPVMEVQYALRVHLPWPWTEGPTLEVPLWVGLPPFSAAETRAEWV